jgi:hypothetical protein
MRIHQFIQCLLHIIKYLAIYSGDLIMEHNYFAIELLRPTSQAKAAHQPQTKQ